MGNRRVRLVLLGPGAVGRQLLTQCLSLRPRLEARTGVELAVVAVADRGGAVRATGDSLVDADVASLIGHKAAGRALSEWAGGATSAAQDLDWDELASADGPGIVVDATAADTTDVLLAARRRGWRIALANKLPLTGERGAFDALTQSGRGARWETTVASALPVVATLQTVLDRGDTVHWVSGTLSGTMGFVVGHLERGRRLSEAVAEADRLGYLEPDPRADLSGLDAARKALILARMLGYPLDLADIDIEGLYPSEWDTLDAESFRRRLPEIDEALSGRAAASRMSGTSLRYLASVGDGRAWAELVEIDPGSRLAKADPADSTVVVETDQFRHHPLVLSGRGGGPATTASGLLGDVIALARERE